MTAVVGSILPDALPDHVALQHQGRRSIVHLPATLLLAACFEPVAQWRTDYLPETRELVWCAKCFPGGRCVEGGFRHRCGRPSYGWRQCREHLSADLDVDDYLRRAA